MCGACPVPKRSPKLGDMGGMGLATTALILMKLCGVGLAKAFGLVGGREAMWATCTAWRESYRATVFAMGPALEVVRQRVRAGGSMGPSRCQPSDAWCGRCVGSAIGPLMASLSMWAWAALPPLQCPCPVWCYHGLGAFVWLVIPLQFGPVAQRSSMCWGQGAKEGLPSG